MHHALLYEINTRCWLRELGEARGREINLSQVPDSEYDYWRRLGFTHIWLMGVWTGGPLARQKALDSSALGQAFSDALPDWSEKDVDASPYAIANYKVPAKLGGEAGLRAFRQRLQAQGMKLILDFVPNHLGLDHPWIQEHPELFVQVQSVGRDSFAVDCGGKRFVLAHGKDPNWPSWSDTVQLDYRRADTRARMMSQLQEIAKICDGVRCDMAMLLLKDVFAKSWKNFPTDQPAAETEFWSDAIRAIRKVYSGFEFLAEVYWGMEERLQALGFNYTYDKVLYDRLVCPEPGGVQQHLFSTTAAAIAASAHFLENHDEPRIASLLPQAPHHAAALTILGLPGMRFLHEGQLSGRRRKLPVQLIRRAAEAPDEQVRTMYEDLFKAVGSSSVGKGQAELLKPGKAWPENPTEQHFVLVQWTGAVSAFDVIAVNLANHRSQCYAPIKLPQSAVESWTLTDLVGKDRFIRDTEELQRKGLYLDLAPHQAQLLHFEAAATAQE